MDMTEALHNLSGPVAVCPNVITYVVIAMVVAAVIAFVGLAFIKH